MVGAVALVTVATGVVGMPVSASTPDDAAQKAADEIVAARNEANAAADAMFNAESSLDSLEVDKQRLAGDVDALTTQVEELRVLVADVAVERFTESGTFGIPVLTDTRAPTDQLLGISFATLIIDDSTVSFDDFEASQAELDAARTELDRTESNLKAQRERLNKLQAAAEAKVVQLREIESKRLQDDAVRAALVAKQQEKARQAEEQARREAEANRDSVDAETAQQVANQSGSDGYDASETAPEPVQGQLSGSVAGGRTGQTGLGSDPTVAIGGLVCPVAGTSAYGDTWGDPRSGGRRHEGVDMLAATGTPLQAVTSGTAVHRLNALGGITVSLYGDNGDRYYYAHLSAFEGEPGRVAAGQIIGYVGDSGNAIGTPHLHFEVHPAGGLAVNPYPTVVAAGC